MRIIGMTKINDEQAIVYDRSGVNWLCRIEDIEMRKGKPYAVNEPHSIERYRIVEDGLGNIKKSPQIASTLLDRYEYMTEKEFNEYKPGSLRNMKYVWIKLYDEEGRYKSLQLRRTY